MEFEIHTLEALAHYTRGGVTIFFIFWNILLRRYRKRSRMMRLLYVTSLLISVCYVKDVLFTFEAIKYSDYLNSLSGIVDIVYVPVLAAFFLETVRPGVVSNRQMAAAILVQASFVPVYILWPTEGVVGFVGVLLHLCRHGGVRDDICGKIPKTDVCQLFIYRQYRRGLGADFLLCLFYHSCPLFIVVQRHYLAQ